MLMQQTLTKKLWITKAKLPMQATLKHFMKELLLKPIKNNLNNIFKKTGLCRNTSSGFFMPFYLNSTQPIIPN